MTPTNLIDNEVSSLIKDEIKRQEFELQMIASENYASPAVMEVMGSVLTNKYAEGYPGKRYYGGCQFVDIAEELAIKRAKKLFGAEAVNVQPHSGAQANMAVFLGFLEPGESIEDAVSRETFEEVGIRVKSIRYVTNQSWPFPHSLMIGCFATATNSNFTIDYNEIEDARWFKKEELVSLRKNNSSIKVARKGTIANYLIDKWINERV